MGSVEAIERVIEILQARPARAVVVSAMSGVTNLLIEIAQRASKKDLSYRKLLREVKKRHLDTFLGLTPRSRVGAREKLDEMFEHLEAAVLGSFRTRELSAAMLDYIMSFGERFSAHMLTEALRVHGMNSEYLDARAVIATDNNFGSARVDFAHTDRLLLSHFRKHKHLQVMTGFIAATEGGKTTTLGRGGSDYTAAIVGAALNVGAIEIWTDVSGIFTADPRLVPKAKVVPELAFEEAGELAYFGAKVLHPKTIMPAMRKAIPVKVLNTFKPLEKGTTIVANFAERRLKSHTIEALTVKRPVVAVHINSPEFFDINGFMAKIFEIFDRYRTSIDVVTTSVTSVSVTVENEKYFSSIVRELKKLSEVTVERRKAIICAVGGGINTAAVVGRLFSVLGTQKIPVEMISQEASNVSITFVVAAKDAERTLKILHKEYIEK